MKVEADTLIRVTAFFLKKKNGRQKQKGPPLVEGKKNKPKYLQKGG
jgi:hypothetical protein